MFRSFVSVSLAIGTVCLIAGAMSKGLAPIVLGIGVIVVLYHIAKGFDQAG